MLKPTQDSPIMYFTLLERSIRIIQFDMQNDTFVVNHCFFEVKYTSIILDVTEEQVNRVKL